MVALHFFIVGAPKSGTTALAKSLSRCPQVCMPPFEPHFLSLDFAIERSVCSWAEYEALFPPQQSDLVLGEKSVSYLYSEAARNTIAEIWPRAKIIILVREPVSMILSLHRHLVRSGAEDCADVNRAVRRALHSRKAEYAVRGSPCRGFLDYIRIADVTPLIERYVEACGERNVKVVMYDDLTKDPSRVLAEVGQFIGAEYHWETVGIVRANVGRWVRFPRMYTVAADVLIRLPIRTLGDLRRKVPGPVRWALRSARGAVLRALETDDISAAETLEPPLVAEIRERLAPSVQRLSRLVGMDLEALWWREG